LNKERSRLDHDISLAFDEIDQFSNRVSTTLIDLQNQKPKEASFPALSVDQHFKKPNRLDKRVRGDSYSCKNNYDLGIPTKRVLDLTWATITETVQLVEAANLRRLSWALLPNGTISH
jgi:hypothetical protein